MPKYAIRAGAEIDVLNAEELRHEMAKDFALREIASLRGLKWMRLPENLYGKATSNAISLGVEKGQAAVGPEPGYFWTMKRLVVTGLSGGASPDVVNLYKNTPQGSILWQFNGNNFGYTFGKLEISLSGGETFALASTGTINSTSQIVLSGELIEVPQELAGKLA